MSTQAALDVLRGVQRINLGQHFDPLRFVTNVSMANVYSVVSPDGRTLFTVVEDSNCCTRNCCKDCGCYKFTVHMGSDTSSPPVWEADRPCRCTCLCFCRPKLDITDSYGSEFGTVVDPWALCNMTFKIQDKSGEDVMYMKGGCCQYGLICPFPCGPCGEVEFEVEDVESGNDVATLMKELQCLKSLTDSDDYSIEFQPGVTPEHKALIMMAAVFVDFRYFDSRNTRADGEFEDRQ
eukprot:Filipodium_phascolosomae@DN4022_c0_g1_i1.p1